MQISVLVERVAGNGFRAQGAEPFGFSAEGATREKAIAKVQQLCQARLSGGAEVVTVEVGPAPHPWLEFAGMFKDDPDFREVVEIMAENRGARHGSRRPLPARPAGEGDSVARTRHKRWKDPCHLVWQVNQILQRSMNTKI